MDYSGLVLSAVEEMFRYVSPVKQFMRTATSEQVLGGVTIPEGESAPASFPAANCDEAVFENPERFDVTRDSNRHIAFGSESPTTASGRTSPGSKPAVLQRAHPV